MIGKNLQHYRILEKLGAGGMGDVYLAEDTKLKRKVAVKVLPEDMALDPVRLARFRREAEAVAALNHPNIVTIYSVEDADGVHFLTMEFVDGKPLQKLIPGSGIDLRQFFDIAIPLADALASAHAKGITHRDLKPPNVMISSEGRVTMLDFGLAKFVERAESAGEESATRARTQDGLVVGTVPYMSPEQLEGKEVDHRTDIFSLGILLYESAAGQKPFEGDTNLSRISAILKDTPRPVTEIRTALPRELNRILERCLEKDPNRRYALARQVRDELEEQKANVISASSSDAVRARAVDKSIAVLPFTNMSADPENEYFSDGLSEEIINALSQLEGLCVAARTSSFSFKGKYPDIGEVGDKLKVATVLEGSVRKAGDRLRITAQLVNVADGYHLWSERFDRTMDDIFDVQDEIATRIAEKLKLTLADEPDQPIVRQVTKNAEAYDLYLKGRFFLAQRGEGIQKALDCFQKALELDPHFAPAHSGKADAYSFLGLYNFWPPKKAFPMARTAANDALALDETLADAHVSLAMVSFYHDWDWPASARAHREALTLKPDHAPAHSRFVLYYSSLGRFDEAYAEARRGLELDPFSLEASINLFWADYLARHHEEGIRHARATLEIHPNVAEVFRFLDKLSRIEGRKTLLVFTDGSDSRPTAGGSKASMEEAIEAGKHSEVTIYTVGFVAEAREVNRDFLERLARATGGRAFFPVNVDHLERSFSAIQEELHTQYRIGYTPRNDARDGTWRRIEVRIQGQPNLIVRTRLGYYAVSGHTGGFVNGS